MLRHYRAPTSKNRPWSNSATLMYVPELLIIENFQVKLNEF